MNGPRGDLPERLLDGDATAFERRVLQNALERGPSRELSLRMARALGVNVTTLAAPPSGAETPAAAQGTALKAAAAPAVTWPWVAAGVLALSVAGVVVGTRTGTSRPVSSPSLSLPAAPSPSAALDSPGPAVAPAPPVTDAPAHPRAVALSTDLRGEIDLLDSARGAVAAKAGRRALEILGRYGERYPSGNFVPEATAVKIEALMQLGRVVEARALATRFVSQQGGTVLAVRIAALVGLPRP